MKLTAIILAAAVAAMPSVAAAQEQQQQQQELRVKEPGRTVFVPHWFMQLNGGAAHTVGEASFGDLISPAAALNVGYQFSPVFGVRIGASGWQARGGWTSPSARYKYSFVQGNVDAMLNLTNLFCGFKPKRFFNGYAFLGAGFNHAFDNDEAVALAANNNFRYEYLWTGCKNLAVGRGGLGVNLRLSDFFSINVEANANLLSDHFNSKKGGNVDWHFNGLVGLTIKFGRGHKETAPVYYDPEPVAESKPAPAPAPAVKEEPKTEAKAAVEPMNRDVFFAINSSKIRTTEQSKVDALIAYMLQYPQSQVTITGYADRATGTADINMRLSQERAAAVASALRAAGISADRITTRAEGDKVQPFEKVSDNRVSVCVAGK